VQFLTIIVQALSDGFWFIGIGVLGAGVVFSGFGAWGLLVEKNRQQGGGAIGAFALLVAALALFCGGVAMALWWALSFLVVYLQSSQPA
jgi:hypothetical protein